MLTCGARPAPHTRWFCAGQPWVPVINGVRARKRDLFNVKIFNCGLLALVTAGAARYAGPMRHPRWRRADRRRTGPPPAGAAAAAELIEAGTSDREAARPVPGVADAGEPAAAGAGGRREAGAGLQGRSRPQVRHEGFGFSACRGGNPGRVRDLLGASPIPAPSRPPEPAPEPARNQARITAP